MRVRIYALFITEGLGCEEVFALFRELGDTVLDILCCCFPTLRCATHIISRRRTSAYLGGEGKVVRMTSTLERLRVGGQNHFPGMSGHWCDSGAQGSSSLRSGDPLGISRMTGGKSSRGMREVELSATCWSSHGMWEAKSAAGGSSLTSRMRSQTS